MIYAEKHISAGDYNVYTRSAGAGKNTILFIHAASISSRMWDAQLADTMLQQYRLVAIDLPGHGKSGRSQNYRMRDMTGILQEVIKQLDIENHIVVAISYSTCFVAEAASLLNATCKGLFLCSPDLLNQETGLSDVFKVYPESYVMASPTAAEQDIIAFANRLTYFKSSPIVELYIKEYMETDPAFRAATAKIIETSDWTDEFANLQQTGLPVGIVFGKEEEIIHANHVDSLTGKWKGKTLFIENAGHFINADQPAGFNKLLADFAKDCFVPA